MVLWILVLLSTLAFGFSFSMRREVNIVKNFKESTQAYFLARAGIDRAVAQLIKDTYHGRKAEVLSSEEAVKKEANDKKAKEEEVEEETEDEDQWKPDEGYSEEELGLGKFRVKIWDERKKANINSATAETLATALNPLDIEDTQKEIIIDSILDWRDEDDLLRLNGAEDNYYQNLPKPHKAKNGAFDTIQELLLVKGVTKEIFYGSTDSEKEEDEEGIKEEDKSKKGLRDLFTVYSGNYIFTIQSTGMIEGSSVKKTVRAVIQLNPALKTRYKVLRWEDVSFVPEEKKDKTQEAEEGI